MKKYRLFFIMIIFFHLSSLAWAQDVSLGVSYNQAMQGLSDVFSMRIFPPIPEKQPRMMGISADGLLTLILAGDTSNLWKATYMINHVYTDKETARRATTVTAQFLKNFVPEIADPTAYLTEMLTLITQKHTYYTPQKLREGNKTIEFLFVPSAGMTTITITKAE